MKRFLACLLTLLMIVSGDALSKPSFGGGSSSSSRPSFGGGSSSSGKPSYSPSPSSSSKPSSGNSPSKPSFGGGSSSGGSSLFGGGSSTPAKTVTSTPIQGRTPTTVSKKPVAESFDKLSGTEARKTESRKSYEKSEAPAPSYKTSAGKEATINPKDKQTEYLRGRLDEQHWQSRYQRTDTFYHGYSGRPVVVYNDFYHPMWNYWLASQTIDVMSLWIYHHQMSMDQARLNSMYAQNADLRARVNALERQGIPRNETYTPPGVDPDLMYDDGYVNAVYNPKARTTEEYEYDNHTSVGYVLLWIFVFIPLIIFGVCMVYYMMFCFRW